MTSTSTRSKTEIPARHPAGMRAIDPGEHLREDYLPDYGLTAYGLAKALGVPRGRIESIIRKKRGISADTALRLARYFGTTPQLWLNMQAAYDLAQARAKIGPALNGISPAKPAEQRRHRPRA